MPNNPGIIPATSRRLATLAMLAMLTVAAVLALLLAAPGEARAHDVQASSLQASAESTNCQTIYRLYNRWSGEHLYTTNQSEYGKLGNIGWTREGEAWDSPTSGTPVYRLYNPYSGDHHYTTDKSEYDKLARIGWRQEGTAWHSDGSGGAPLYRLFNPYEQVGTHHYTASASERDNMVRNGWKAEGVAWYGHKWADHYGERTVTTYTTEWHIFCTVCGDIGGGLTQMEIVEHKDNHLLNEGVNAGTGSRPVQVAHETSQRYVDGKVCTCCGARK